MDYLHYSSCQSWWITGRVQREAGICISRNIGLLRDWRFTFNPLTPRRTAIHGNCHEQGIRIWHLKFSKVKFFIMLLKMWDSARQNMIHIHLLHLFFMGFFLRVWCFVLRFVLDIFSSLQWRHKRRDGVSNNQPRHCLLNCFFSGADKKTSKLRVTGRCAETHRSPVNSPQNGQLRGKCFHLMTSSCNSGD